MNDTWKVLYDEAMKVINPHDVSPRMWVGSVATAILTKKGTIYTGICIDTDSSICLKDGKIIPSCGDVEIVAISCLISGK